MPTHTIAASEVLVMDEMQELFTRLEVLEVFIIRATCLIGISLFCLLYVWNHIKNFKGSKRKKYRGRKMKKGSEQLRSD